MNKGQVLLDDVQPVLISIMDVIPRNRIVFEDADSLVLTLKGKIFVTGYFY